jgi:phosphopantothenoylcysteine decarboxylase/phosphopantothenate--cysteine ligase
LSNALPGRRIALAVGGGIAAYKSCELLRELQQRGASIRVAMTPSAAQFVGALTFQSLSGQPVLRDLLDEAQEATFGHIQLAKWAELFIVAPATADLLARIRAGMANDAVTASLLAYRGPVLLAPAMNAAMFEHPTTQENLAALRARAQFRTVGPGEGQLACGDLGPGRMSEPAQIADEAARFFEAGPLSGKRVLLTAGPTREYFDPVRFLSNPSSGKMGLAMAEAAQALGASVTVVLGPSTAPRPSGISVVDVVTAEEMAAEVMKRIGGVDAFVAAAAVSDYRPKARAKSKHKKSDAPAQVELVRTPDILLEVSRLVASRPRKPLLVGFAAETENVAENARQKLSAKGLDFIVANDVSAEGAGFAGDANHVSLLGRAGEVAEFSGNKASVAQSLWSVLAKALTQR